MAKRPPRQDGHRHRLVQAVVGLAPAGEVGILVHNVGLGDDCYLADMADAFYEAQSRVNLKAPIVLPIVLFLCSEESRWVTDSVVSASGGLMLIGCAEGGVGARLGATPCAPVTIIASHLPEKHTRYTTDIEGRGSGQPKCRQSFFNLHEMTFHDWTVSELRPLLPLDDDALGQIVDHAGTLADTDAAAHFQTLLGGSADAEAFVAAYLERRRGQPEKQTAASTKEDPVAVGKEALPSYSRTVHRERHHHTNPFTEAANARARDEQEMQQLLQQLQYQYGIYNSEIIPEHDCEFYCGCPIHQYHWRRQSRYDVMKRWSKAVQYPGDKFYTEYGLWDNPYWGLPSSVFGTRYIAGALTKAVPKDHANYLLLMTKFNNQFNKDAQARVDASEPTSSVWATEDQPDSKAQPPQPAAPASRFARLRQALGATPPEQKKRDKAAALRNAILIEEQGRWPDPAWRRLVAAYQAKVGMADHIATLRARAPLQYLHLLRAGYFEPIPVAWANQASNPLTFVIEPQAGIRGITPAWRGYEDLAEERLYWVLNHRAATAGAGRLKPDAISALRMAQERMATAVEPPPLYFAADDTCVVQHTTAAAGYSKQVLPAPFHADGLPEQAGDDTMILLDVSGSMDFPPMRPIYDQYLITGYQPTKQPKNRDVARAIVRRFTDALDNHHAHDGHPSQGYDLVTFSDRATYIGTVHHANFDAVWGRCVFGGRTRVMTGWQLVKDLHFQKHAATATHHPVYGWQAGPATPVLRLLLLLDGEAADMDEFELDLLGLAWAHVTVFLIGVDGCPHHHRHANELQRISDVNPHVSFVDAQGNCPERFVTHELLKRHLGYDLPLHDFEQMEHPPVYAERA